MMEPMSKELLVCLDKLRRAWPGMRFGQMVSNLAVVARGTEPSAIWDMEDEELLAAVEWQLSQLDERKSEVA